MIPCPRRSWPLAVILMAAFCIFPVLSGATPVPGEFLLKFTFPVDPGSWWHDGNGYLMTGIPSVDTLNVQYHVTEMIPIFYPLSSDPEVLADQEAVGLDRIFKALMDPVFEPAVAAADYDADPATEYAEPNDQSEGDGPHQYFPNDEYFDDQWYLHNTGQTGGTPDADIDAPEAWMIQRGDSNVVIAIVDMGVDYNHKDLKSNIWINPGEDLDNDRVVMDPDDDDDIDNDGNGKVDDFIGWDFVGEDSYPSGDEHGTMVASVLAAVTDNDSLLASISTNCRLMIARAGSGSGSGSLNNDKCAQAIEYAARNGADVINMSWSNRGSTESLTIREACIFAYRRNCVLVASAGNSGSTVPRAPAHWEDGFVDVISVAGTDHDDQRYSYGGKSSNYGNWVDFAAPGEGIGVLTTGGGMTVAHGTSFSAAVVSGLAAMVISAHPSISNVAAIEQLESTCDDIGLIGMGAGRINAHSALQLNLYGWNPDMEVSTNGEAFSAHSVDVAVSGDTVYAAWAESPSLPIGVPEIYFSKSTDNGDSWSAPIMLSADDGIGSNSPSVAAEGSEVYVAWLDGKWGANTDISFRYSNDYGSAFAAERNATQTYATASSDAMDLAMADSVAHLTWIEHAPGDSDCYYRALRNGARYRGMYTVSSIFPGTNAVMARADADGQYVHIAWEQNSGGGTQIVHRRNTSKGDSTSWSNGATLRNVALGVARNPDVAAGGRYAYVIWDEDNGLTREIMLRRNICRGHPLGWESAEGGSDDANTMSADEARVTAHGEGVDIVWSCYNGFNFEIYNVYSLNHGATYSSERRVTFNAGDSFDPSVECAPGWASNQVNYLYLVWPDNSHSSGSSRARFKRHEPRDVTFADNSGSYNFDDHDLSGWGGASSGGNTISISGGPNVSAPNSLMMNSQSPGCAWTETPANTLDLLEPHWLTTWLYLDGASNDSVIVMDNQEVLLSIVMGNDLISGTGLHIQTLSPYQWYLIECYATPSTVSYDVYVDEEFKATVPFEAGPSTQTIKVGDVTDGSAGYGTILWDNLGYEGLRAVGVTDLPPSGRKHRLAIQAFPNPFRHGVNIAFTLPVIACTYADSDTEHGAGFAGAMRRHVEVLVFDVRGRLVRTIKDVAYEGRRKSVLWNGRTGDGRTLPSGTYLVTVRSSVGTGVVKAILLK